MAELEWSGVFSSLPLDIDTLVDAGDLAAVEGVLRSLDVGEWKTAGRIAEELGWPVQRTAERVRRAIKELQLSGLSVVECHAGFTIANSVSMMDRCIEKEEQRLRGLERTIGALRVNREHMTRRQSVLRRTA